MAYRNTFFRWLFLYSLTFGLTYVLKLFTYLCPETGQMSSTMPHSGILELILTSWVHPAGRRERRMGLTWIGVAGGGAYFSDFGGLGGGC